MVSMLATCSSLVNSKTPMSFLSLIILNSLMVSYFMMLSTLDLWSTVLLLMVYISGIMVLFMYIVSLSPSSMGKSSKSALMVLVVTMVGMSTTMMTLNTAKEPSKFSFSFEKIMSIMGLILMMLVMMGIIIPKAITMNHKGMKASK